jgi:hypothetical protein
MRKLKALSGEVKKLVIDHSFRRGENLAIDVEPFTQELESGRSIPLEPLATVLEEAMRRGNSPGESDQWLGPRVHATLRLTRREAADKRVWNYLTVAEFPKYVLRRWRNSENPDDIVPVDRFLGEDSKNALARLWWAAELTRNGPDYSATTKALSNSRFGISWQHLDSMHHRPAALAVAGFLEDFGNDGATDYQGQVMAKAFNLALRTLSLDALSENVATDAQAIREWCEEEIDVTKMLGEALPIGPDEASVPKASIDAVRSLLDRLADRIGLATQKQYRASRKGLGAENVASVDPGISRNSSVATA